MKPKSNTKSKKAKVKEEKKAKAKIYFVESCGDYTMYDEAEFQAALKDNALDTFDEVIVVNSFTKMEVFDQPQGIRPIKKD